MRLVKLSTEQFKSEAKLQYYFDNTLPKKEKGKFFFGSQIGPAGLHQGERMLFTYRKRLRYVAKAKTGRRENKDRGAGRFSNFIVINLPVAKTNVSVSEVERKLHAQTGLEKSLSGQTWTKIPDDKRTEKVIKDLLSAISDATKVRPVDLPEPPARYKAWVSRFIRDTPLAQNLKRRYDFICQIRGCDCRIEPALGVFYVEVHHVRPLGGVHAGRDVDANMLVLCPNHHAMFDFGIPRFLSAQRVKISGVTHFLTTKHALSLDSIQYYNTNLQNRIA